ncbi:MAG: class I SAM-dependent methyltransferase [Terriglobales bacterium]
MAAASPAPVRNRPDYGLDAAVFYRRLLPIGCGLWVIFGLFQLLPQPVLHRMPMLAVLGILGWTGGYFLVVVAVAFVSSRWGKLRVAQRMAARLSVPASARILDVGCGRGLAGITVARRLPHSAVTGVDVWSKEDLIGNRAEVALANATAAGVAGRFSARTADARQLPFPDGAFDAVVSMTVLHNIHGAGEREKALAEIARVLRPGGQAAIFDIRHTAAYARFFRQQGWPVRRSFLFPLWLLPGRYLLADKPAQAGPLGGASAG